MCQKYDPKDKPLLCRTRGTHNFKKVIGTLAQSPNFNPFEKLCSFLKKQWLKGAQQTTPMQSILFSEEWNRIPLVYNLENLIHSTKPHLHDIEMNDMLNIMLNFTFSAQLQLYIKRYLHCTESIDRQRNISVNVHFACFFQFFLRLFGLNKFKTHSPIVL